MSLKKFEIDEALVEGGERLHGLTPYNNCLCGAIGEDGSEPHRIQQEHEEREHLFTDQTEDACRRCLKAWQKLPD